MTCEAVRELIRRRAQGETLVENDGLTLDSHLADCPSCRMEARFEALLAETIRSRPAATPSPSFTRNVLAALPAGQPAALPVPSYRDLWGWALGGVGLAAAAAWGVWHFRETWLRWLLNVEFGSATEVAAAFTRMNAVLVGGNLPLTTIGFIAFLGLVGWGATALAESR